MSEHVEFADQDQQTDMHRTFVVETRHWLTGHDAVRKLFDEALQKHDYGIFRRNTLDDLRLSLELPLRFGIDKAIEIRSKVFHGQLTDQSLCQADFLAQVPSVRE